MNLIQLTIMSQEAIEKAREIADASDYQAIGNIHILKGILTVDENFIPFLLKMLNVHYPVFIGHTPFIMLLLSHTFLGAMLLYYSSVEKVNLIVALNI